MLTVLSFLAGTVLFNAQHVETFVSHGSARRSYPSSSQVFQMTLWLGVAAAALLPH